ncbi:MAG: rhodanese-like domain-containing protein [Bdellovibrionales bacterium]|nr:rhodanese-like domain-containing protein [Bdellovibrionales bacterium]
MDRVIVDVREEDEFAAEHVEGSINIPLSKIEKSGKGVFQHINHKPISIMCRSGKRATLAMDTIRRLNFIDTKDDVKVYTGGILEWKAQGHPVVVKKLNHLPILRQVHLIAGAMALTFALLGYFVNQNFVFGAAFVGMGLAFAGATGTCLMAILLAKMPWNASNDNLTQETCTAGTGTINCAK